MMLLGAHENVLQKFPFKPVKLDIKVAVGIEMAVGEVGAIPDLRSVTITGFGVL